MCFVWIWEQTSIISLYSINWLVCITETECVYCAVRTGYLNIIWVICFIWIWEQTAIISLYSINWLVCITERECVYCAVRTGYLKIFRSVLCIWCRVSGQRSVSGRPWERPNRSRFIMTTQVLFAYSNGPLDATSPSALPKTSTCFLPVFTRRTDGHRMETFWVWNFSISPY